MYSYVYMAVYSFIYHSHIDTQLKGREREVFHDSFCQLLVDLFDCSVTKSNIKPQL